MKIHKKILKLKMSVDTENSFVLNNQAGIAKKRAMKNIGMQNLAKYTIRGSNTGQRKLKHANLFIVQSKLKTSKQFAFTTVETLLQNLCFRCVRIFFSNCAAVQHEMAKYAR